MDTLFWSAALILMHLFLNGSAEACSGSTCEECISADPSCSWCAQKDFKSQRCQTFSGLIDAGCDRSDIQNPTSSTEKREDEAVRDSFGNSKAVQIQPQRVRIKTRPRKRESFTVTFRAANNYPVDLYFLFDNSLSMNDYIRSLALIARDIGMTIKEISSNYLMGYGVFQDKVILPFTDTTHARLLNPCAASITGKCAPPFEFRHRLKMTHDIGRFESVVNSTGLTGNIDRPEGSTDAILQAVTCKEQIGWRERSRKLLIFASNDRFHIAGDGKLAGIVIPNDGECHLDNEGHYTKELLQDYPSVSQLTDIVSRHEVHVIFAVTDDQLNLFKELSKRIPHSTVEVLAKEGTDNRDIREIIEKKYREIISEVQMLHVPVDGVDIKIKAKSSTCERQDTNVCKGIAIGKSVEFDVEVTVASCGKPGEIRQVEIYPGSLSQDKLIVEIETQCECDCASDQSTWEENSPACTGGNGTLICGQCSCNTGRFGRLCECDAADSDTIQSECTKPGDNSTGVQCNGAGRCVCGTCQCDDGFSGDYCECNDRSCGSFQGQICGGSLRGRCDCGHCDCEDDFSGDMCECSLSNDTCLTSDRVICSGHGDCECGECICEEGYIGLQCENCRICDVCNNQDYRRCAECLENGRDSTGSATNQDLSSEWEECRSECSDLQLGTAPTEDERDGPGYCSVKLPDSCFFEFHIKSDDGNVTIFVMSKTCPTPVDIVPVVVGAVVGVVVLGIAAILLWKLITWFYDKREYSKFQEELAHGRWAQNDNPFYKGATTTYRNPMMDASDPSLDKN